MLNGGPPTMVTYQPFGRAARPAKSAANEVEEEEEEEEEDEGAPSGV